MLERIRHDLRRALQLLALIVASCLGAACALDAQDWFTREQFAVVMGSATYEIPIDSTLLRSLAKYANVRIPDHKLQVLVVPGNGFACGTGRCSGAWVQAQVQVRDRAYAVSDYIFVAEDRLGIPWILRHEYLHFLLQDGGHPLIFKLLGIPEYDDL